MMESEQVMCCKIVTFIGVYSRCFMIELKLGFYIV